MVRCPVSIPLKLDTDTLASWLQHLLNRSSHRREVCCAQCRRPWLLWIRFGHEGSELHRKFYLSNPVLHQRQANVSPRHRWRISLEVSALLLVCKHLRVVVSELPFPASSSKQGCQYQAGFSVQASGSNHAYHDQTQYKIELTFSNRIHSVQHARRSLDLCHTATVMFRFWEWISKVELPSIAAMIQR
jgi:hypothetical protein